MTFSSRQHTCARTLDTMENRPWSSVIRGRETIIVTFAAKEGTDATRALRALLKIALRRHGLRCIAIVQLPSEGTDTDV